MADRGRGSGRGGVHSWVADPWACRGSAGHPHRRLQRRGTDRP